MNFLPRWISKSQPIEDDADLLLSQTRDLLQATYEHFDDGQTSKTLKRRILKTISSINNICK